MSEQLAAVEQKLQEVGEEVRVLTRERVRNCAWRGRN